jgi:hypothetical protein
VVNGVPQQGDIIKLDLDPRIVTLDYEARSFKFVEKVPSDFLLQLLDIARRIFTV